MELKVWVEGIQRIVCGVNEKTTCQDVVFALAHATGKTGRFTLIERWRNSERLLAPNEQPLKVLLKWGEHSNDVQFILQWSPLDSATNKSGQLQSVKGGNQGVSNGQPENLTSDNSSPQSLSPASKTNFPDNRNAALSGAPTSQETTPTKLISSSSSYPGDSGSRGWSHASHSDDVMKTLVNDSSQNVRRSNGPTFRNGPMEVSKTNETTSAPGKGTKIYSPPPYREPPSPSIHSTPPLTSSPSSLNSPGSKNLPPYREPPPPNHSVPLQTHKSSDLSSNGNLLGHNVPNQKDSRHPLASRTISPPPNESFNSATSGIDSESWSSFKDPSCSNGGAQSSHNGSSSKTSPSTLSSSNYHYIDLIRVVNCQREKLTSQQAELTQYDAEIMYWESKAKDQQKNMDLINKEISRLELMSAQHESQVLSLAHLEEESEYAQRESIALKSEILNIKTSIQDCDDEIAECKGRIRSLMTDLHTTQQQMAQRKTEWREKEAATIAEIDKLRRELEKVRHETESTHELAGSLDEEVKRIEANLSEKKKQMERLVAAMKEANLQSLSIQPPDDLMEVHHRSGSTRRMIGSPRQLENAAPTSKNPHGVWV